MTRDGMAEVLRLLDLDNWSAPVTGTAAAGAGALQVDGLAVSLVTKGDVTELLCCSGETSRRFEDLQLTLGEGPGRDAIRTGALVWAPDLARASARWPALAAEACGLAARAVFCFPMAIGAIRLGVLTAVRVAPGSLTARQTDDAIILAATLTARCLGGGRPRPDPRTPVDPPETLQHAVVHQATGMVSAQLALSLPEALLRLRAHAYSSGQPITDIAQDVVDRRLRLDRDDAGAPPPS